MPAVGSEQDEEPALVCEPPAERKLLLVAAAKGFGKRVGRSATHRERGDQPVGLIRLSPRIDEAHAGPSFESAKREVLAHRAHPEDRVGAVLGKEGYAVCERVAKRAQPDRFSVHPDLAEVRRIKARNAARDLEASVTRETDKGQDFPSADIEGHILETRRRAAIAQRRKTPRSGATQNADTSGQVRGPP